MDLIQSKACLTEIYERLFFSGKVSSRADFAKKCGILPATFRQILIDKQSITVNHIYKICAAFPEISPNDFFRGVLPHLEGDNHCVIKGNNIHDNTQNDIRTFVTIISEKDRQINHLLNMIMGANKEGKTKKK